MLETSICGRNWIIMRHGSWSKWYNSIMTTSDRRKHGNQETNTSHNNYSHNKTQRKQNKEISSFQFLLKLFIWMVQSTNSECCVTEYEEMRSVDSNPRHMMVVAWQQCHWLDDNDDTDRHWPLDILIPELIRPRDTMLLWHCDTVPLRTWEISGPEAILSQLRAAIVTEVNIKYCLR